MIRKTGTIALAALMLAACDVHKTNTAAEGYLSFDSFSLVSDDAIDLNLTKAITDAPGSYVIKIYDARGIEAGTYSYAEVQAAGFKVVLPAGDYTLEACSDPEGVPAAAFEKPVYGASAGFTITAGASTSAPELVCTLQQCKVTVGYEDKFLESVTGAGAATVEITSGHPLSYALDYNGGNPVASTSAGYFEVNNGDNTTMTVSFKGSIDGKLQKMTTRPISGIRKAQWRQVTFVKKINEEGNAVFTVRIDGYIEDEELTNSLNVSLEEPIGEDPDAPKGDGGITLDFAPDCTMFTDLSAIRVPKTGTMDLRLVATVPGGVAKFTVEMASTNASFIEAVQAAGGTTLDLVHPSAESAIVFQIVPFPHGEELLGKTSIDFNLSAAQEPILAFGGTHSFTMKITDRDGCRNEIEVKMIVED